MSRSLESHRVFIRSPGAVHQASARSQPPIKSTPWKHFVKVLEQHVSSDDSAMEIRRIWLVGTTRQANRNRVSLEDPNHVALVFSDWNVLQQKRLHTGWTSSSDALVGVNQGTAKGNKMGANADLEAIMSGSF